MLSKIIKCLLIIYVCGLGLPTIFDFFAIVYAIIEFSIYYFSDYSLYPQTIKLLRALIVIRLIRCFRLSALNKGSQVIEILSKKK